MAHAPESDAQLHFVEYINRTTSYAVGSNILIDAVFNRPFTATGTKLHIELAGGKIVQADLDTTSDGERILKYSYTITSSDDTSSVNVVDIIGTLKKKPKTAFYTASGDLRNSSSGANTIYTTRSVKDLAYGAQGDGVVDDSDAIQSCLDAGDGQVIFPAGTYKCTKRINVPKGVDIFMESGGLLDFSGNADASVNSLSKCVMVNPGSLAALPDLASNHTAGDSTLTLTASPDISVGDVIVIYNPTDSSFSGHRTYYRQGEVFEVKSVSGAVVGISGALLYDHAAADVDIYKVNNAYRGTIDGLNIKGVNDGSNASDGLAVVYGVRAKIRNCRVWNCSSSGLLLQQCFFIDVNGCALEDNHDNDFGLDYGVQVLNCSHVNITDNFLAGARHGLTFGGSTQAGSIPCRFATVRGNYITHTSESDTLRACNVHGNCERMIFTENHIIGGMDIAGDYIRVVNNFIDTQQTSALQAALFGAEFRGYDFDISNNRIVGQNHGTDNEAPIIDTRLGLQALNKKGGTFIFENNHCTIINTTSHAQEACFFKQRGYAGANGKISLIFRNNFLTTPGNYRFGLKVATEVAGSTPWDVVDISGNTFYNMCGPNVTDSSGSSLVSARKVFFHNNTIHNADITSGNAWSFVAVSEMLSMIGNNVDSSYTPALVQGASGTFCRTVIHKDNNYNNVPWGYQSASPCAIRFRYITNLIDAGDVVIGTSQVLVVSDGTQFAVGNSITGGTSGATATVYAIDGNRLMLKDSISGGPFQNAETVTDDVTTNSSTAVGANTNTLTNDRRYVSDITNCWRGDGNISTDDIGTPSGLSPINAAAITNDDTTI